MRILILGGGWFLGRAVAEAAVASGHQVAVFNRGRSGADPDGVERIRGDRESDADLKRLATLGPWDAVIDSSGQVPLTVLAGARALSETRRYVFVSSVSAYAGWPVEPLTEESPLLDAPADLGADFDYSDPRGYPTRYGFLKAGCERAVTSVFGLGRSVILRPGVILGPWEYIGRLPWWLRRVQAGGRILAPGRPAQPIQPVDVRDVAAFAVSAAVHGEAGPFNVTAPPSSATFGAFLCACRAVTGSDATFEWVDDDFLIAQGVRQWTELPIWRSYPGTWQVSWAKAQAAGLVCRPIEDTVADTWAWLGTGAQAVDSARAAQLGISQDKERSVLAAWDERSG